MRLRHLSGPLEQIVDTLMQKTKMSRSECNTALASIYDGYEEFRRAEREGGPMAALARGTAEATTALPTPQLGEQRPAATGTHG
jgi:hypothetical protein